MRRLMLNDLVNPTTNTTPNTTLAKLARRTLVAVSLVMGVGLAGVGFARGRAEQRAGGRDEPAGFASPQSAGGRREHGRDDERFGRRAASRRGAAAREG